MPHTYIHKYTQLCDADRLVGRADDNVGGAVRGDADGDGMHTWQ